MRSRTKKAWNASTAGASDEQVRALLHRYECPVAFHEVRTRFLGNIASPVLSASPIDTVKALWGGELPAFESIEAANELIAALIMGLWNRLTRHQARGAPFRLLRNDTPATREGLGQIALVRRQEIDGFLEGLFSGEESIDLPERAQRALNVLSEIRGMLEAARSLAIDWTKPASSDDIAGTIRNIGKLTTIAEQEMHATVLSCARARRQMLAAMPATR
jgi:hypothetical protein